MHVETGRTVARKPRRRDGEQRGIRKSEKRRGKREKCRAINEIPEEDSICKRRVQS
jgi:hypothetical protein